MLTESFAAVLDREPRLGAAYAGYLIECEVENAEIETQRTFGGARPDMWSDARDADGGRHIVMVEHKTGREPAGNPSRSAWTSSRPTPSARRAGWSSDSGGYWMPPGKTAGWAVGLQPPALFRAGLFDQLFDRTMASMTSPVDDVLPIVLDAELRGGPAAGLPPEAVRRAAGDAGLERALLQPVCMAVKRETFAGRTREFFFVVFDVPEVTAFRRRLGELAGDGAGPDAFGPLDLILPIAGSDTAFTGWWPVVVDRDVDCQAPVGS